MLTNNHRPASSPSSLVGLVDSASPWIAVGLLSLQSLSGGCASQHRELPTPQPLQGLAPTLGSQDLFEPSRALAARFAEATDQLLSVIEKQNVVAGSLHMKTIPEVLAAVRLTGLVGEMTVIRNNFQVESRALSRIPESSAEALDAQWTSYAILLAVAYNHNLNLQVIARADLALSDLANNQPLVAQFQEALRVLLETQEDLSRSSIALARTLNERGIDTALVRISLESSTPASPALQEDWAICVNAALMAGDELSRSLLIAPGMSVGEACDYLTMAAKRFSKAGAVLETKQAITDLILTKSLLRALDSQLKDDIEVSLMVKREIDSLPASERANDLAFYSDMAVEKTMVHRRYSNKMAEDATEALARLDLRLYSASKVNLGSTKIQVGGH